MGIKDNRNTDPATVNNPLIAARCSASLPDSGKREVFEGGAVREPASGRGRFDLIPAYPYRRLAVHYEKGAVKYEDDNWRKGLPLSRFLDSMERHLNAFKEGDRVEDHLASIVWNAFGYMQIEKDVLDGKLSRTFWNKPYLPSVGTRLVPPTK